MSLIPNSNIYRTNSDGSKSISTVEKAYSEVIYGTVAVANTATPIYVGIANLSGRAVITIQPKGGTIYIGFDNSVTAGSGGNGIRVASNDVLELEVDDGVTVYGIKSGGGTRNTFVSEGKQ